MQEPSVIINGISELVRQVLPLMVVVGILQLEPEKLAGWISIISFTLAFISTFVLRSQVTSNAKADAQIVAAKENPDAKISTIKAEAEHALSTK